MIYISKQTVIEDLEPRFRGEAIRAIVELEIQDQVQDMEDNFGSGYEIDNLINDVVVTLEKKFNLNPETRTKKDLLLLIGVLRIIASQFKNEIL
jgi:hypothetical protein